MGGIHPLAFSRWTNASAGAAWLPDHRVRAAIQVNAAFGSGPDAIDRETTVDVNMSYGDARTVSLAVEAVYVLASSHPARGDSAALLCEFVRAW